MIIRQRPKAVLDIEAYRNYILIALKNIENGKVATFERSAWCDFNPEDLIKVLTKFTIVTFNGRRYDEPVLKYIIAGATPDKVKALSDDIIVNELRVWDAEKKYNLPRCLYIDHIDLIEVAPGQASLKIYGGRVHSRRMQDLPIEPDAIITEQQRPILGSYCVNDLDTTIDLFTQLKPQIELRERMSVEYEVDLRSKSDAQIAEAVIRKQIEDIKGERIWRPEFPRGYSFKYQPPSFIRFDHPELRKALEVFKSATFTLDEKGDVVEPKEVGELNFTIGQTIYQLGIGGIHSCEKTIAHVADGLYDLYDRDVTSYYPNIILNQRLMPGHLGPDFLKVYKAIVDRRIAAKKAKDKVTDAALKITINGSFGKFGSKWSVLYGPNLMVQTTVTGQLSLLMLVDRLEARNIRVVSANTDGIVIKCHRAKRDTMLAIFSDWERETGFQTEETQYTALYSRDINNYIALKPDGTYKVKGAYADPNLSKTPTNQICVRAVVDWLQFGIPIETTIKRCTDIRQFVNVRQVAGGAIKVTHTNYDDSLTPAKQRDLLLANGWQVVEPGPVAKMKLDHPFANLEGPCDVKTAYRRHCGEDESYYLGKAVRWYYAKGESGSIAYKKNGNKVNRTQGAKPIMELPNTCPNDIDHDWYIHEAESILSDIGVKK